MLGLEFRKEVSCKRCLSSGDAWDGGGVLLFGSRSDLGQDMEVEGSSDSS